MKFVAPTTRFSVPLLVLAVLVLLAAAAFGVQQSTSKTKSQPDQKKPAKTAAAKLANVAGTPVKLARFEFTTAKVDANGNVTKIPGQSINGFSEDLGDGVTLDLMEIPAGSFEMGSSEAEVEAAFNESKTFSPNAKREWFMGEMPKHKVTLPPFYLGKFEVTQAQWRAVAALPKVNIDLKPSPSNFKGDGLPVENVNWEDALEFCDRLSKKTGRTYRLPSEAEWEYAARAGSTTPFAFGETITPDIVNYDGRYPFGAAPKGLNREQTSASGSLGVANAFGLYDMHGNVWEWCQDLKHANYNGAPTDGSVWTTDGDAKFRSLRSGSWNYYGRNCRSGFRYNLAPDTRVLIVGFRVVVSAKTK